MWNFRVLFSPIFGRESLHIFTFSLGRVHVFFFCVSGQGVTRLS